MLFSLVVSKTVIPNSLKVCLLPISGDRTDVHKIMAHRLYHAMNKGNRVSARGCPQCIAVSAGGLSVHTEQGVLQGKGAELLHKLVQHNGAVDGIPGR